MQLRDFNIKDRARGPNKTIAITNIRAEVTDDSALEIHLYCAGKGSSAVSPAFNEPLISATTITPEVKIENDEELSPAHISPISVASIAQLSNHIAAVKKFSSLPIEGINKMKSEVYTSETLRRENLVRLFDVYSGKGTYLLVYKYMENKSLADVFFGMLKDANILLDDALNVEISDFGNSILYAEDEQDNGLGHARRSIIVSKQRTSNPGYMAQRNDITYYVYGYEVVVLEIVSGKENSGNKFNQMQREFLVEEVCLAESKDKLLKLVDTSLSGYDRPS
nr:cysteine-rich receptor-like protein kinase 10 [Ziziphus jujuba var. spinosa]